MEGTVNELDWEASPVEVEVVLTIDLGFCLKEEQSSLVQVAGPLVKALSLLSLQSSKPCQWACRWHANIEANSRFMSAWALEVAGLTTGVVTRPHCSRVMWKSTRWTGWLAAAATLS